MNYFVIDGRNSLIIPYDDKLKSHLRISDDTEEDIIKDYIRAAGNYIEKYLCYPICSVDIVVMTNAMNKRIDLPRTVSAVTKLEKFEDEVWSEITGIDMTLENYGIYKSLYNSDFLDNTRYRVTCENEPCITPLMRQAAYLLVAEFYENKENRNINVTTQRPHVDILLDKEISL